MLFTITLGVETISHEIQAHIVDWFKKIPEMLMNIVDALLGK